MNRSERVTAKLHKAVTHFAAVSWNEQSNIYKNVTLEYELFYFDNVSTGGRDLWLS